MLPSSLYLTYTNPFAPTCGRFTKSVSSSSCLRVYEAQPGTQIPPIYSALLNTAKSLVRARRVRSANFIPKRISGLSQPYCSIASCHVIRGNAGISIPLISLKRWRIISSKIPSTSSRSTNDISQSIWVNSGWRSARRSSSRKHFTIW